MDFRRSRERLSAALRIPSISLSNPDEVNWAEFLRFIDYLEEAYPLLHHKLEKTVVGDYALLYRWKGQDEKKLPVLFTAHYDVVPAEASDWSIPPFSGQEKDEKIWGRGAIDDKGSLISILEAVEALLEEDFTPDCDLYFAFGCDEEVGGKLGAQKLCRHLQEQGLRFRFLLDEGGAIAEGKIMGTKRDLAVVGMAEKGNNAFRFYFTGDEGHASAPPKQTSLAKMARFISKVEDKPLPTKRTPTVEQMLKAMALEMSGVKRFVMSRPKFFWPLIKSILMKNKQTAAMLRSTVAFTMTQSGTGYNILPEKASCTANVRILQGDSVESVTRYFRSIDAECEIEHLMSNEPTTASAPDSEAFSEIRQVIQEVFPDVAVIPYLMVGGTDSRYYEEIVENTYRFLPCRLSTEELASMHGKNEYISYENYARMIEFYTVMMRKLG